MKNNNNLEVSKRRSNTIVLDKEQAASILNQLDNNSQQRYVIKLFDIKHKLWEIIRHKNEKHQFVKFVCLLVYRTTSLPNFLGTFVQPNLTITNSIQNIINNNNNDHNSKPTVTVVQTAPAGFKVVEDDVSMVIDDVKLQSAVDLHSLAEESALKSEPKTTENNNRQKMVIKEEDQKTSSPSSSPFIDINSLPMVFDDTKLFQNVSSTVI